MSAWAQSELIDAMNGILEKVKINQLTAEQAPSQAQTRVALLLGMAVPKRPRPASGSSGTSGSASASCAAASEATALGVPKKDTVSLDDYDPELSNRG